MTKIKRVGLAGMLALLGASMGGCDKTGSLQVNLSPPEAVEAGAHWSMGGGALHDSGAIVSGLSVGAHSVAFNDIAGWITPVTQNVPIAANETQVLIATYAISGEGEGDTIPPGEVVGFTAVPGDGQITLSWSNPVDPDFAGVQIQRKTEGYPTSPTDGATAYKGNAQTYTDLELSNGTAYSYLAYAYDGSNNFAAGVRATAVPMVTSARTEVLEEYSVLQDDLSHVSGSDDRQVLEEALEESERLYRGGDFCGAASALQDYLSVAQEVRGTAPTAGVKGVAEALYNGGRMLRFDMLANEPEKEQCPGAERVGVEAAAVMDDPVSDNTRLKAAVTFGEPRVLSVNAAGDVFTQVHIPGTNAEAGVPGEPAIPVYRRLIAVPQNADVSLSIVVNAVENIQMNLAPVQEHSRAGAVNASPPLDFFYDSQAYQTDELFPPEVAVLRPLGQCRELQMYMLEVSAGQYNPVAQTLTLFKDVQVDVTFSGGSGCFRTQAAASPFERITDVSTGATLNATKIGEHLGPIVNEWINQGEELILLTPPDFMDAAITLANWKNQRGIVTRIFVVNDPASAGLHTAEEIRDMMLDHYRKAKMRPSYALLLGDAEFIPPFYMTSNVDPSQTIASDWPYSNMPPEGLIGIFDVFQDIAVGRIPVDTDNEAYTVVNKIIDYESNPPTEASFYQRAAVCSQFQCCRKDVGYALRGSDQALFIWPCETARRAMVAKGYTVDLIYTETIDGGNPGATPPDPGYTGDATPRRYWNGQLLPVDLRASSGFGWNGGTNDIINAWNDGRFLMIHVDHGSRDGWVNPPFDRDNVRFDIDAGGRVPLVFSMNCSSGYFDNEIVDPDQKGESYFAERLIRFPGRAIGVIAASRDGWIWPNAYQLLGFVDAIFPDTIPDFGGNTAHRRLGDILVHGNLYLLTQINITVDLAAAADEIHMFHLFGDPTLEIWTSDPWASDLPPEVGLQPSATGLKVRYGVERALITAFQQPPGANYVPLGRGTVRDGVADLTLVDQPVQGSPVRLSVERTNAITKTIVSTMPDITPPGDVMGFDARGGGGVVELSWLNPSDADFAGVRIQRKTDSYPASPTDGVTVYDGTGEQTSDTNVENDTPYYYAVFAHDGVPNYAPGVQASATPNTKSLLGLGSYVVHCLP